MTLEMERKTWTADTRTDAGFCLTLELLREEERQVRLVEAHGQEEGLVAVVGVLGAVVEPVDGEVGDGGVL